MLTLTLAIVALASIGHAAFWVGLVNRWHATGFPRPLVKSITLVFYAGLVLGPLAVGWQMVGWEPALGEPSTWTLNWTTAYVALCAAYGALHLPIWVAERLRSRRHPGCVQLRHGHVVDMVHRLGSSPAGDLRTTLAARVPGNQLWHLHVSEFSIDMPRLAAVHDGLSICHWSDLHFSGRIDKAYYHEVVRLTNLMQADLIVLSGDICDKARCIDWIGETLAGAQARLGKYFILGNHDLRTRDVKRLRGAMREAGFVDLGGRSETLREARILLAGNERPWFDSEPEMALSAADSASDGLCKILLAHTPDHFAWARARGFDLMLAGHTHGGQIRFPWIGPVVCPSWHGTKYAAGFFHEPPTVLHVSRGTASLMPLRFLCPPEITKLVLRSGAPANA